MSAELAPPPRRRLLLPTTMLRLVSDERLVEQLRAGSERAFEVLFDRHHRAVLAFCRQMLGSAEEAEDAVQQTFLAAYGDLAQSDKPIAPRPWLFAIARNRCLSMLRARRSRPVAEASQLVLEQLAAGGDRREELRALLTDLARLPEDRRAALLLAELAGFSHDEIGQILGCRRERVKALVFQARSYLAAGRVARETPCDEIREQLATLRGSALRRTTLRRHLHECPGCREFDGRVRSQRRGLAALLPAAPDLALKHELLGALVGSGGGGALGGGGLAAKALIGLAIATGGGAAAGVTAGVVTGPATPAGSPPATERMKPVTRALSPPVAEVRAAARERSLPAPAAVPERRSRRSVAMQVIGGDRQADASAGVERAAPPTPTESSPDLDKPVEPRSTGAAVTPAPAKQPPGLANAQDAPKSPRPAKPEKAHDPPGQRKPDTANQPAEPGKPPQAAAPVPRGDAGKSQRPDKPDEPAAADQPQALPDGDGPATTAHQPNGPPESLPARGRGHGPPAPAAHQ